jgi:hypothetical protein
MATHTDNYHPSQPAGESSQEQLDRLDHLTVYSHSNLMYWWPLWLVCFILAAITYIEGNQMAVVPDGTVALSGATVSHPGSDFPGPRDVLVAPRDRGFGLAPRDATADQTGTDPTEAQNRQTSDGYMTVSSSNSLGVVFATTLLVVAIVSTLLLRGLVSLITVILMIMAVFALALFDLWDDIFLFFGGLDIRMNAAGYLFIGVPLFLVWLFVFFVYDRQVYVTFDEGQIRYVLDIGDSVMTVPAEGVIVEKLRSDVFRHWVLGAGAGDLIIRMRNGREIELPNILNANRRMTMINDFLRHKPITITD